MKNYSLCMVSFLMVLCPFAPIWAVEMDKSGSAPPSSKPPTVNDLHPGLTNGALVCAKACELPKGMLLRAGNLVIHNNELSEEIARAPQEMQPELNNNALFYLEQIAAHRLLLAEAKAARTEPGEDLSESTDRQIMKDYLQALASDVDVNDTEIRSFYESNAQMFGGTSLAQLTPQIKQFLLQEKQQEFIDKHIRTIGQRISVEISASWLKKHAALARDNPVDKVRGSGKSSLVDFGSVGCIPCDMMAPILETLGEKYKGRLNVLFVNVRDLPILAGRYGIQSIPVQVFFDKNGKEIFRHSGFFSEEAIEGQLSKMGVK